MERRSDRLRVDLTTAHLTDRPPASIGKREARADSRLTGITQSNENRSIY